MGWICNRPMNIMRNGVQIRVKPGDPVPEAATWGKKSPWIRKKYAIEEEGEVSEAPLVPLFESEVLEVPEAAAPPVEPPEDVPEDTPEDPLAEEPERDVDETPETGEKPEKKKTKKKSSKKKAKK